MRVWEGKKALMWIDDKGNDSLRDGGTPSKKQMKNIKH